MNTLRAYLTLTRPANLLTAVADILLGFAASGSVIAFGWREVTVAQAGDLAWLIAATVGLYGGGVVLNDVFDAELDRVERPERPIPSGRATLKGATVLGIFLLVFGITAAAMVNPGSAGLAALIALAAVWYDAYGKHHPWLGPVNMGLCRGLNVLLGMSVLPMNEFAPWLGLIPVLYIGAVTTISRGEVHGDNRRELWLGFSLYVLVTAMVAWLSWRTSDALLVNLPFLLLFIFVVFPPLVNAIRRPQPAAIGKAVKAGVLALIVLDAALAAGFAGGWYGLGMLLLLPVSRWLARSFAVT